MVEALKEVSPEEGMSAEGEEPTDYDEVADIMSMAPEDMLTRGFVFNPADHMRTMTTKGGGQYLDVKWRKLWLLSKHPNVVIKSQLMRLVTTGPEKDQVAVFKASVTIPGGGHAEAFGSETMSDFKDFIEKAETKALGRALENLGYGTAMAKEDAESLADAPVEERGRGLSRDNGVRREDRREERAPRSGDRPSHRREEPEEAQPARRTDEHAEDRVLPMVKAAGNEFNTVEGAKTAMANAKDSECGAIFAAIVQAKWPVDAAGKVREVWTKRGRK